MTKKCVLSKVKRKKRRKNTKIMQTDLSSKIKEIVQLIGKEVNFKEEISITCFNG